jgi:hypothetical protein
MPIEHEVLRACPSTSMGRGHGGDHLLGDFLGALVVVSRRFSRITANSSPPRRATVSEARTQA